MLDTTTRFKFASASGCNRWRVVSVLESMPVSVPMGVARKMSWTKNE